MKALLASVAMLALAAAAIAPARAAGIYNADGTIVTLNGAVGTQIAIAVGAAVSRDATAEADVTVANAVNAADLADATTAYNAQQGVNGAVSNVVDATITETGNVTAQVSGALGIAASRDAAATATVEAVNVVNSASQTVTNTLSSTRH